MTFQNDPEICRRTLAELHADVERAGSLMAWCEKQEIPGALRLCWFAECVVTVTKLRTEDAAATEGDLPQLLVLLILLGARLQQDGALMV